LGQRAFVVVVVCASGKFSTLQAATGIEAPALGGVSDRDFSGVGMAIAGDEDMCAFFAGAAMMREERRGRVRRGEKSGCTARSHKRGRRIDNGGV
jgi:hypothetical protein